MLYRHQSNAYNPLRLKGEAKKLYNWMRYTCKNGNQTIRLQRVSIGKNTRVIIHCKY